MLPLLVLVEFSVTRKFTAAMACELDVLFDIVVEVSHVSIEGGLPRELLTAKFTCEFLFELSVS